MHNGRKSGVWLLWLLVLAAFARGEALGPLALVNATVDDVIADMNANEARYRDDPASLEAMVHRRIVPHFDVPRMVRLALGKNWADASDGQRQQVIEEFREMMIRSYMKSMFAYRKEKISLRGQEQIRDRNAMVRLRVVRASGEPVDLVVRMYHSDNRWQVVDVMVGGVSMLATFRSLFQDQISRTGIDGLIESLRRDNLGASPDAG